MEREQEVDPWLRFAIPTTPDLWPVDGVCEKLTVHAF